MDERSLERSKALSTPRIGPLCGAWQRLADVQAGGFGRHLGGHVQATDGQDAEGLPRRDCRMFSRRGLLFGEPEHVARSAPGRAEAETVLFRLGLVVGHHPPFFELNGPCASSSAPSTSPSRSHASRKPRCPCARPGS